MAGFLCEYYYLGLKFQTSKLNKHLRMQRSSIVEITSDSSNIVIDLTAVQCPMLIV